MIDSTETTPTAGGWSTAALAELRDIAAAMLADAALCDGMPAEVPA